MNEIFTALIHQPVFNILAVFYRLLGDNLGLAIIAIALLARFILLPLAIKQMKMLKQNKIFSDQMKEVKEKYKNDKERQQKEMMKMQSEVLPAQLAGCLPLIVQFILLITISNVFYQVFTPPISITDTNNPVMVHASESSIKNCIIPNSDLDGNTAKVNPFCLSFEKYAYGALQDRWDVNGSTELRTDFLSLNLNEHPSKVAQGGLSIELIPYLLLIALVGGTQYYSAKIMQPKKTEEEIRKEKEKEKSKAKSKKSEKEMQTADFSETLQKTTQQTMFLLPILIMATSFSFPAGLSLYWVTQNIFVIIQQLVLNKFKKEDNPVSK